MKKKKINKAKAHKVVAMFMLALATVDFATPIMAMENVTSGNVLNKVNGNYGADLRDVTGATVSTDYTNATITNTQTNSVLNWNNLNTAPNQSLTYIMKDGDTSLNNVVGTSLSKFAGSLTAEHGRVIISNPNGMIFENGSYVNANALTLTTHHASIEDGNLRLYSSDKNATIKFNGNNIGTSKVRLAVDKDLNIVSNNIDVNNANIVAKDTKLITADGVTFYAVNNNSVNDYATRHIATAGANNIGNVNINNANIAVLDRNTGKISIITKGNVNVNKTGIDGKIDIVSTIANGGNITLDKVTSNSTVKATGNKVAMYNSTVNNVDLTSNSDIKMQNVNATGVAVSEVKANNKAEIKRSNFKTIRAAAADITFTDTNLTNANLQGENVNVNVSDSRKTASINNSTISATNNITVDKTIISDSLLIADNNINANGANISNTEMNVGRNVYAGESVITDSLLNATNDLSLSNSYIENSTLIATKDLKLENSNLNNVEATGRYGFLNDANLNNGTNVDIATVTEGDAYNSNATVENLTIDNATLKSKNNMNLKNTKLTNATLETTKDVNIDTNSDISLVGINIAGNLNITNAGHVVISNSSKVGKDYIPNISKSTAVTDYNKAIYDDNYFENIINSYGQDFGRGTRLSKVDGNVNISNTKSSLIINSVIGGNLRTENAYYGTNVIKSNIEGSFEPNRIGTTIANVYDSFIGGDYELAYANQVIDKPTILPDTGKNKPIVDDKPTVLPDTDKNKPVIVDKPTVLPDVSENKPVVEQPMNRPNRNNDNNKNASSNNNNNQKISSSDIDDHNKRKFGNDVNTKFNKRFSPRGFAASDDKLTNMKNQTKASVEKNGNKIRITKSFHAY